MKNNGYIKFTKDMKREYTILIPDMLPVHFNLIRQVLSTYGYRVEILQNESRAVVDAGLKNVHNDTCYPAILVIGQFIDALNSGKYDVHKVALMLFQTGGGCRASNYVSLLRKALIHAGYGFVPVVPFSLLNLERHPGFRLTVPLMRRLMYAVLCGDLLMCLYNQRRTVEAVPGQSKKLLDEWTARLAEMMGHGEHVKYRRVRDCYARIVRDFQAIEKKDLSPVKVGIVGEIYVKFSSLGNNGLEQFLVDEGAEVCVPGFLDFCFYCIYNSFVDKELYRSSRLPMFMVKTAFGYAKKKQRDMIEAIENNSSFEAMTPFENTIELIRGHINLGVKMGEGWLLPAEMLELYESGAKNIVCVQPFGCLPNHICGSGMMKPLKASRPDINIVAIDYDAGATSVNQLNRIKLMLSNAADRRKKDKELQTV